LAKSLPRRGGGTPIELWRGARGKYTAATHAKRARNITSKLDETLDLSPACACNYALMKLLGHSAGGERQSTRRRVDVAYLLFHRYARRAERTRAQRGGRPDEKR